MASILPLNLGLPFLSPTIPIKRCVAENTLRTGETQKNQNRQYGDKKERHHKDSVRFSF